MKILQLIERKDMFIRNMRAHVSAYQSDVIGLQDRLLDSQNKLIRAQDRQSSTRSHSRTYKGRTF